MAYPTPPVDPEQALTATSYRQAVTREVRSLHYWLGRGLADPHQVFFACELMQVLAIGFVKLGCMFLCGRIFREGTRRAVNVLWTCVTGFIGVWTVGFFFALLLACGTHSWWLWDSLDGKARCASTMILQNAYAVTDVVTDLLVLIFPIPLV